MPDIVSRIKIQADGAEAAAREIRKLKDAYEDVGDSAKGISPGAPQGSDPFAEASNLPALIPKIPYNQADDRLRYNKEFTAREGGAASAHRKASTIPGMISQGFKVAESADAGHGVGAMGGVGAMLAGAGPVGWILGIVGALGMGLNAFANKEYARVEKLYGSGTSQRLGSPFNSIRDFIYKNNGLAQDAVGIPQGMIDSLFAGASRSGAEFNVEERENFRLMARAAASTGTDASLLGQSLGAAQRAGGAITQNMLAAGLKHYGRGSFGTFMTGIHQSLEEAMTSGIELGQDAINARGNLFAGLAAGGLAPTGAVALGQKMLQRGQGAAQLSSPEDLLLFSLMREEGESITDTRVRMEEDPIAVNKEAVDWVRSVTDDEDVQVNMLRNFLDVSISQARRLLEYDFDASPTQKLTQEEIDSVITADPSASPDVQGKQTHLLEGFQDAALGLQTGVNQFLKRLKEFGAGEIGLIELFYGSEPVTDFSDMTSTEIIDLAEKNKKSEAGQKLFKNGKLRRLDDPDVVLGGTGDDIMKTGPSKEAQDFNQAINALTGRDDYGSFFHSNSLDDNNQTFQLSSEDRAKMFASLKASEESSKEIAQNTQVIAENTQQGNPVETDTPSLPVSPGRWD